MSLIKRLYQALVNDPAIVQDPAAAGDRTVVSFQPLGQIGVNDPAVVSDSAVVNDPAGVSCYQHPLCLVMETYTGMKHSLFVWYVFVFFGSTNLSLYAGMTPFGHVRSKLPKVVLAIQ